MSTCNTNLWKSNEVHNNIAACPMSERLTKYVDTGEVVNSKIRKFFFVLQDKQIERDLRVTISVTGEQNVVVELTNDQNPVFFFILHITKNDFDCLRSDQGLNIEFKEFAEALVRLLDQCKSGVPEDEGKFKLMLVDYCGTATGGCVMDMSKIQIKIIEECAFKNICHLTLDIMRGTESQIRQKLETEVYQIKQALLKESKAHDDSLMKVAVLDEQIVEQNKVIEKLNEDVRNVTTNKEEECNAERVRVDAQLKHLREEYDEKISQERTQFQKQSIHAGNKLDNLEKELRVLHEHQLEMQTILHERERDKELIEVELISKKHEISQLKSQNEKLDTDYHDKEKTVNILRTRLAVAEQELKDNNILLLNHQSKLEELAQEKINYQTEIEFYKTKIDKKESALKTLTDEILKANEIISKQQLKINTLVSQVNEIDLNCVKLEEALKVKDDSTLNLNGMLDQLQKELASSLKNSHNQMDKILLLEKTVTDLNEIIKKKSDAIRNMRENFKDRLSEFQTTSSDKSLLSYRAYLSLPSLLPSDNHRNTDELWDFLLQTNKESVDTPSGNKLKIIKPYIFRYLKRFMSVPLSLFKSKDCTPLSVLIMPEGNGPIEINKSKKPPSQENISNTTEYAVFNKSVKSYLPRVQSDSSIDNGKVQDTMYHSSEGNDSIEKVKITDCKSVKNNYIFPNYAPVGAFRLKPTERYQRPITISYSSDNKLKPGTCRGMTSNLRKMPAMCAPPLTPEQRNATDSNFKINRLHRTSDSKSGQQNVHKTNSLQSSIVQQPKQATILKPLCSDEPSNYVIKDPDNSNVTTDYSKFHISNQRNSNNYKNLSKVQESPTICKPKNTVVDVSDVSVEPPEPSAYFAT